MTSSDKVKHDKIIIGKITSAHGIAGEVKVYPLTDDPGRFSTLKKCYISREDLKDTKQIEVKRARYHKGMVVILTSAAKDRNEAETLRDLFLSVDRNDAVKPEDSFFVVDLIGLEVTDDQRGLLGTIEDVFDTGSNDVIQVKRKGKKPLLIPFLKDVCYDTDIEAGCMKVRLPEGLYEIYE